MKTITALRTTCRRSLLLALASILAIAALFSTTHPAQATNGAGASHAHQVARLATAAAAGAFRRKP